MQVNGTTSASAGTAAASGPQDQTVHARAGETVQDVAQRTGVSSQAIHDANPDLANPDHLLAGQPIRIPAQEPDSANSPAVAGVAGAVGREGLVQSQMQKAYDAGQAAPQEAFDGKVLRGVPTAFEDGVLDHTKGSPGRYNSPGERLIYTSPDLPSVFKEAAPYTPAGKAPLAERSLVELHYTAAPDAQGRGGVADLAKGAQQVGLPVESLTQPKGGHQPSLLHRITGEHPYTLPQQAAKGAIDAGASGLRAPSAEAKAQINVVPANTRPGQLKPVSVVRHDAQGLPGLSQPANHIKPLPANDKPVTPGPLDRAAGARPPLQEQTVNGQLQRRYAGASETGRPLSAGHQSLEPRAPKLAPRLEQAVTGAREGYPRASSLRYGAAGGAAATLVDAAISAAQGKPVQAGQVARDAALNGGMGAASGKVIDAIAPRLGLVKAGGAVGGAIEAGVSGYHNYQAYKTGQITGSQAVANTVVDTGSAVAAGAAGAAVGAAVGSVVPIAGNAVGAVAGFAVGVGVHYGIRALDSATGVTDKAKQALASGIDSVGHAAGKAWHALGSL